MKALEWEGQEQFNQADDKPWNLSTGKNQKVIINSKLKKKIYLFLIQGQQAGRLRSHKNLKFLQVYDAGHMVPMDQPQAASEMLNAWLDGSLGTYKISFHMN